MSEYFDAFDMGPLAVRGPDAVAPEPFRGIYAMPMFVTIPTVDLEASTDFWVRGLGFIDLFSVPRQVVHLRRWAYQDVLLVPSVDTSASASASAMQVSFSCVLSQLDAVAEACRQLSPSSVTGPHDTPWGTRDVEVVAPDNVRVVMTAARTFEPDSPEAKNLASAGIVAPESVGGDDHGSAG